MGLHDSASNARRRHLSVRQGLGFLPASVFKKMRRIRESRLPRRGNVAPVVTCPDGWDFFVFEIKVGASDIRFTQRLIADGLKSLVLAGPLSRLLDLIFKKIVGDSNDATLFKPFVFGFLDFRLLGNLELEMTRETEQRGNCCRYGHQGKQRKLPRTQFGRSFFGNNFAVTRPANLGTHANFAISEAAYYFTLIHLGEVVDHFLAMTTHANLIVSLHFGPWNAAGSNDFKFVKMLTRFHHCHSRATTCRFEYPDGRIKPQI